MEFLDTAAGGPAMEELLDFSSAMGKISANEAFPPAASYTETGEEELEWVSNKDAFPELEFPAYESFLGVVPEEQQLLTDSKHHSPVSVLENSSSSSNSNVSAVMIRDGDFRVPVKPRSNPHRKRRIVSVNDGQQLCLWGCSPVTTTTKWKGGRKSKQQVGAGAGGGSVIGRKCLHCGAEQTPQWRAGPMGPKTLCNACGVRYKSGRLVPEYRPASSPSFVSELHSNSHRKIVEMRRQKQLEEMGMLGKAVVENGR